MSYFLNILMVCLLLMPARSFNGETRCKAGSKKVLLLDGLLTENDVGWLNEYLGKHRPWVLNQEDIFKQSFVDLNVNTTWVSPVTDMFKQTRVWKKLSDTLKQMSGKQQYLCQAMFTLAYRLDFKPVSKLDNDGLIAQIFLNEDMRKNDYGETVFYNDDNELVCGIHQYPGRVLVWNSSMLYASKPPSMLYMQTQNSIMLTLTHSFDEYQSCGDSMNSETMIDSKPTNFPFIGQDKLECLQDGKINYTQHLTNKYYDSLGREIAVFDNVLSKRDLQKLREYLTNDIYSFGFHAYDTDQSEDHDNVAWISVQKSDVLTQSDLWQVVKQAAAYLSTSDQWYPYDVSMNIVHSFDHTRIHEDCEPSEDEFTFLLYLNPEWHENLYGETVFFEQVNMGVEPGDEEYETVAVVRPRYGRIVMFQGIIPHSARPPSPNFQGARYTFACKVSKTYTDAKSKKLKETLEALEEVGFKETLKEVVEKDDDVNEELMKQTEALEQFVRKRQQYLENKLSDVDIK